MTAPAARRPRRLSPIARVRKEAGFTQRQAAEVVGLCLRNYQRLEAGVLDNARDPIGLRLTLAAVFGAALGRPVSAQWDLCGLLAPAARAEGIGKVEA